MQPSSKPNDPPNSGASSDQYKIAFFDWDDTLFPSYDLFDPMCDIRLDRTHEQEEELLQMLETSIIQIFDKCSTNNVGIYVITKATKNWVMDTMSKHYPKLHSKYFARITIVSTQNKFDTFTELAVAIPRYFRIPFSQVTCIAIGDSHDEMDAIIKLRSNHPDINAKFVKFLVKPTIEVLAKELTYLSNTFEMIAKEHLGPFFGFAEKNRQKFTLDTMTTPTPTNTQHFHSQNTNSTQLMPPPAPRLKPTPTTTQTVQPEQSPPPPESPPPEEISSTLITIQQPIPPMAPYIKPLDRLEGPLHTHPSFPQSFPQNFTPSSPPSSSFSPTTITNEFLSYEEFNSHWNSRVLSHECETDTSNSITPSISHTTEI